MLCHSPDAPATGVASSTGFPLPESAARPARRVAGPSLLPQPSHRMGATPRPSPLPESREGAASGSGMGGKRKRAMKRSSMACFRRHRGRPTQAGSQGWAARDRPSARFSR